MYALRLSKLRSVLAALAISLASVMAFAVVPASPAGASDPANSYIWTDLYTQGHWYSCLADIHHRTNLYGYAVASTDNGRNYPGEAYDCYSSWADVYYPYLQKASSGWYYFPSVSASSYQASPAYSEHMACMGHTTFHCTGVSGLS
jgi:hypothetical protein